MLIFNKTEKCKKKGCILKYAYCAKIMLDFRKLLVVSYTLHYCGEVALLYSFLGNEAQRI